jgi:KUP system potassium uptake protein
VLAVLSLVFWSLNFLITFKYLSEMMKVDNRGEGGILALLALLKPNEITSWGRWALISAGLFGSALLYGDGIITRRFPCWARWTGCRWRHPRSRHT